MLSAAVAVLTAVVTVLSFLADGTSVGGGAGSTSLLS